MFLMDSSLFEGKKERKERENEVARAAEASEPSTFFYMPLKSFDEPRQLCLPAPQKAMSSPVRKLWVEMKSRADRL